MQQRVAAADRLRAMTIDAPFTAGFRPFRFAALLGLAPALALSACAAPRDEAVAADETDGASSDSGADLADGADDTPLTTGADDDDADTGTPDPDGDTGGSDDEGESDTTGNTATTGDSGEPPVTCSGSDGVCAPDFPEGWEGPVAVLRWAEGEEEPACAGDYDLALAGTLDFDLDAPEAACGCECGDPSGGVCDGALDVYETAFVGGGCLPLGAQLLGSVPFGEILDFDDEVGPLGIVFEGAATYDGGSCSPIESISIPAAAFESHLALCAGTPIEAPCDNDAQCMPTPEAPADDAVCLWQEGDLPCPSGWGYAERTVVYQGMDDTRSCSDCDCGQPQGECSFGTVQVWNNTLGAITADMSGDENCTEIPANWTASAAVWGGELEATDDVTCNPSGGLAQGGVEGTSPITVCCRPLED
ncbi:MAG: hypothetical protein AAF721_40845 [Myxococcota bacterium]